MKAQLQLPDGRLLDAWMKWEPTPTGGQIALKVDVTPPYPEQGLGGINIFLDGYYVYTTETVFPDPDEVEGHYEIEQRIGMDFNKADMTKRLAWLVNHR